MGRVISMGSIPMTLFRVLQTLLLRTHEPLRIEGYREYSTPPPPLENPIKGCEYKREHIPT